jgi:hypothetical protein
MVPMNQGKQVVERGTPDCEKGLQGNPDRGGDALGKTHVGSAQEAEHAGACDWKRAHNELVRLARDHARLEWDVGRWLLRALRAATSLRLGYASMAEYAHRLFGFDGRFTSEKLRVAETLEELPELSRALREGELTWSAVRELTRVATPATEADWLAVARGRASRDIERMVSGRKQGDRPDDPADNSIVKHVLRFEVRAETRALVREALAKLRREADGRLDDDAALLLMARQVLGGPKDAGRASYQISITKCDECRRAHVHSSGELVEVGAEVLEMAECDAQNIGRIPAGVGAVTNGIVNAGRGTGTGTGTGRSDGETETTTHAGAETTTQTHVGANTNHRCDRAAQDVPPAIRRLVFHRDHGRCQVPGCRHAQFVDIHHIERRVDGGDHDPDGLILLCGAHHHASHRGELFVSGRVSTGLRFRHADGTEYGGPVAPRAAESRTKVFQALSGLGFGEKHVKLALEQVGARVGTRTDNGADFEPLFREVLAVLTR